MITIGSSGSATLLCGVTIDVPESAGADTYEGAITPRTRDLNTDSSAVAQASYFGTRRTSQAAFIFIG